MKLVKQNTGPINVLAGKERSKNLYVVIFDARQVTPRVSIGSTWVGHDHRYNRRFLFRVVELGYTEDFDLKLILGSIRENPEQPLDERSLEYYCAEKAWVKIEGELSDDGHLKQANDQPTILQTFLIPTTLSEERIIAATDIKKGFLVGNLRSGSETLSSKVTIQDRFNGYRSVITGASGYGKSTAIRNICRYWLENTKYGKLIDDLKCEYVGDIEDEMGNQILGLCHHPDALNNLYLFTPRPSRLEGMGLKSSIAGLYPLKFGLDDIPPITLKDVATHTSPPQQLFLEMFQDRKDLFRILTRKDTDGNPDTSEWQKYFKGFILLTKEAQKRLENNPETVHLGTYKLMPSEIQHSSYTPIHSIIKQLDRLSRSRYITKPGEQSCIPIIKDLLRAGKTLILDKSGLTDEDRMIISIVLSNALYDHNEKHSSGTPQDQNKVIPFVYVVEEAHLLLSRERVREGSIFVNFAKTGRSFKIGLVLVTQRPSSIEDNILSQCDNFITFRLTFEEDIKDLVKASGGAFTGYEVDIQNLDRGAAVVAFGETRKVQTMRFFPWTEKRAKSRLSDETLEATGNN